MSSRMLSNFSALNFDPKLFGLGLLTALAINWASGKFRESLSLRRPWIEFGFISIIATVLFPVYVQNSSFFTMSPDSQGLLRSPEGNTTYRPPLLWAVYRIFASQSEIDEFFQGQPIPGQSYSNAEILQGSNFILFLYLFSLLLFFWSLYRYLKVDAQILTLLVLIQVSGPLYFQADYFFIPPILVPLYHLLIYALLWNLTFRAVTNLLSNRPIRTKNQLAFFPILVAGIIIVFISSRTSLMVDELNQIMSETLTMTLVNFTLALSVVLLGTNKQNVLRSVAISLGLSAGLLVMVKLSTILTPLFILVLFFLIKIKKRERISLAILFCATSLIPLGISSISGTNSETSQTWFGLVPYAIEFQHIEPKDLAISQEAQQLLDLSLVKRQEIWEKDSEIVSRFDFTWQKTAYALYFGALPAARELGYDQLSPTYTSEIFKEITLASFSVNKRLTILTFLDNFKVPLGLFKNDGAFMSMSKILKNPIVYVLLIIIGLGYHGHRKRSEVILLLLMFSLWFMNYVVVSIFGGPIPRYFYIYDPFVLYAALIMFSKSLGLEREKST